MTQTATMAVQATPRRIRWPLIFSWATIAALALYAIFAIIFKIWVLTTTPINSDSAVVGLMASAILHGHMSTFYWGQVYGGVEPYVVAVLFTVLPRTPVVLTASAMLLGVVAAIAMYKLGRRIFDHPLVTLFATILVGTAPYAVMVTTNVEYGFRAFALADGMFLLYGAVLAFQGRATIRTWLWIGLTAGLGWWATPEIVFFALPAAILVIIALSRIRDLARVGARLACVVGAFIVGSLPWWWTSIRLGFANLTPATFNKNTWVPLPYGARLEQFFVVALPQMFFLRAAAAPWTWLVGRDLTTSAHLAMTVAVVTPFVIAVVVCLLTPGIPRILAGSLLTFPFIYAANPATTLVAGGRYYAFCPAIMLLVGLLAFERVLSTSRWTTSATVRSGLIAGVVSVTLLGAAASTMAQFELRGHTQGIGTAAPSLTNPDPTGATLAHQLKTLGVTTGWSDYWQAYLLNFYSGGALRLSEFPQGRNPSWTTAAIDDPRAAWVFVQAPGMPNDVGPFTAASFLARLGQLGVTARVITLKNATVVIPHGRVTPAMLAGA